MFKRVVMAFCCSGSLMVSAAQVTDLYQGKAPTSGDVVAAQGHALGQVLIKVTGKRDILTQPAVVKALAAPSDYVKSYGYQDLNAVKYLAVEFKHDRVNRLVAESQYALLGPTRPQMVAWLVVDQGERRLLADQSSDGWAQELRDQALPLGLSISIPLMDLDDNMAVSATDVWGRFADPVLRASQRYGADMVVLGTLTPDADSWRIDWELYGPNAKGEVVELIRGNGSGAQAAVVQGFTDALAEWQLKHYGARIAGSVTSQTLVVAGLSEVDSLITVQKLLQGMAVVSQVAIGKLEGDRVTFNVTLQGEQAELERALLLERRLHKVNDKGSGLRYQWSQP